MTKRKKIIFFLFIHLYLWIAPQKYYLNVYTFRKIILFFWLVLCNAKIKNSAIYNKPFFLQNQEKTQPISKKIFLGGKGILVHFFLIFFLETVLQRAEVSCLAFSASRCFFWAIKLTIRQCFWQFDKWNKLGKLLYIICETGQNKDYPTIG